MIASVPLILFPFCLIAAALNDGWRYMIPNELSIALVVGFVFAAIVSGMGLADLANHVGTAFAVLALGFGLFCINVFGAGDGKLLAAVALWFGWPSFLPAMIYITFAGGALCLFILLARIFARQYPGISLHVKPLAALAATDSPKCPYGIAIAAGSLLAFQQSPLFEALTAQL